VLYDQFGNTISTARVFGFVPPPARPPVDEPLPRVDAVSSTVVYPIDEVYEL
jgi:hypothetical protein